MRSLVVLLCACSSASSAPPSPTPPAPHAPVAATPPITAPTVIVGDPGATGRVIEAHVVAAIGDGIASDRPAYARIDQRVTLYAALVVDRDGKRSVYSDAKSLRLAGKTITPTPIAKLPAIELRWNRIEPAAASMSNGDTPADFTFAPIDYRATPIDGAAGRAAIAADVRPTLIPDHGQGLGTMRYQIVALQGERVVASAGPEARRGKGSGGVTDAVLRVSIRRDDTYLGYLTEMYGQPYIWASAGITDTGHQSEHLEGSDCADFIIYGKRRSGTRLAYTWTGGLPGYTTLLAAGDRASDGVYRDRKGQPLPFTQAGDLVLFPRHVGVLAVDRGTPGVLDDQDLMMHTLFDTPKEQAIGETSYADKPLELRRFKR
ncbi:MAG: hypothetical protein ABI867_04355 [Kofleriaceae bacterium]